MSPGFVKTMYTANIGHFTPLSSLICLYLNESKKKKNSATQDWENSNVDKALVYQRQYILGER